MTRHDPAAGRIRPSAVPSIAGTVMLLPNDFRSAMSMVGEKIVSHTDVSKGAYVPNQQQRDVMTAASYEPVSHTTGRIIDIIIAGTEETLPTTYYAAIRETPGRNPEVRMGRGLVNWIEEDDTLLLGTDGSRIFALKYRQGMMADEDEDEKRRERFSRDLSDERLEELARSAVGQPTQRTVVSTAYERNPFVREFARRRSGGKCEMPGCSYVGFVKDDGAQYIEVHHVDSLATLGVDDLSNVVAICPNCHAKAHYAQDREAIARQLRDVIRDRP